MKDVLSHIRSRRTYFDGGFGTLLQAAGLPAGTPPELWNLTKREEVTAIHRAYLEAGSHIITTISVFLIIIRRHVQMNLIHPE